MARDPVTRRLEHAAHQWLQAEDQVMQLFGVLVRSLKKGRLLSLRSYLTYGGFFKILMGDVLGRYDYFALWKGRVI